MRGCSSLHDHNLLKLPHHFFLPFFFNLLQTPLCPYTLYTFSTLPFFLFLLSYCWDNRMIPVDSLPLSRQCCYNSSPGSLSAELSKHKRYEVRLSVYNAVGEGPISAPQEVFVGEAGMCLLTLTSRSVIIILTTCILVSCRFTCLPVLVPTAPPLNVMVQSSTATQLDVTWDPPPLDAQNGDIQGYKVSILRPLS